MAMAARMRRQGHSQGSAAGDARSLRSLAAAGLLATALVSGITLLAGLGGPAGATNSHVQTIHVSTAKVPHIGTVLTTSAGLTLYRYGADPAGTSTCTGVCAKFWPPFLASKGAHIAGPKGVKGLSLMKVSGGRWQVAFHKFALYRFVGDKKKGQAAGQDFESAWFAALKSGSFATTAAPPAQAPTTSTSTTHATTSTTTQSSSHAATTTPPTSPPQTPAQTPTTQAPAPPTTQPPPPPTTTPTTSPPPTTTPTTTGGGGGVGF